VSKLARALGVAVRKRARWALRAPACGVRQRSCARRARAPWRRRALLADGHQRDH